MPNNFIFNTSALDLKTQIFASDGTDLVAIKTDSLGNVNVSLVNSPEVVVASWLTTVTGLVSVVNTAEVSIVNTPEVVVASWLTTVTGLVSVINTPEVSIVNTPEVVVASWLTTVTGLVSVVNTAEVSVVNTPEVVVASWLTTVTGLVSVINTPSVEIHSVATASDIVTVTTGSSGVVLAKDTSMQKNYSYYIYNVDGVEMTVVLQLAPINSNDYYINDTTSTYTLPADSILVMAPMYYLHWTRLSYDAGAATASFVAYYNATL